MNELTHRQKKALPILAAAPSVTLGCENAGVSRKTVYQWMKDPAFADALSREREPLLLDTRNLGREKLDEAMKVLDDLLHSENPSHRLRAVKLAMENAVALLESDFEKRLAACERDLKEMEDRE